MNAQKGAYGHRFILDFPNIRCVTEIKTSSSGFARSNILKLANRQ
jgi:hypothetical protein